jgi:hypothetical protein
VNGLSIGNALAAGCITVLMLTSTLAEVTRCITARIATTRNARPLLLLLLLLLALLLLL